MLDRLIELLSNAPADFDGNRNVCTLAEHLLANGVIVPHCRLNQKMWVTDRFEVNECKVSSLTQKADGSIKIRLTDLKYRSVFEITVDKIGKTVFLTREAAEQALKGGVE